MRKIVAGKKLLTLTAISVSALAAASGFAVGASSGAEPERSPASSRLETVSVDQVSAFAGAHPERCVFSRPDLKLCTWKLEGNLITPGMETARHGVNLVCEVPIADDASVPGSCTTHARSASDDLPPVGAEGPSEAPELEDEPIATTEIDDARILVELAQRLGAAPDVCRTGFQEQTCYWRLSPERVTRTFQAIVGEPLVLRCTLPLDGSGRAPGSCSTAPLS